jgi:hypothetical protein
METILALAQGLVYTLLGLMPSNYPKTKIAVLSNEIIAVNRE